MEYAYTSKPGDFKDIILTKKKIACGHNTRLKILSYKVMLNSEKKIDMQKKFFFLMEECLIDYLKAKH